MDVDLKDPTFEAPLLRLRQFSIMPIENSRDRAGIIKAFDFTFEQCWKSLQKRAGREGVQVASPRQAFAFAMSSGWILPADENSWLKMIEDRNLTSHTYKEDIAQEVLARILGQYIGMFENLILKIR